MYKTMTTCPDVSTNDVSSVKKYVKERVIYINDDVCDSVVSEYESVASSPDVDLSPEESTTSSTLRLKMYWTHQFSRHVYDAFLLMNPKELIMDDNRVYNFEERKTSIIEPNMYKVGYAVLEHYGIDDRTHVQTENGSRWIKGRPERVSHNTLRIGDGEYYDDLTTPVTDPLYDNKIDRYIIPHADGVNVVTKQTYDMGLIDQALDIAIDRGDVDDSCFFHCSMFSFSEDMHTIAYINKNVLYVGDTCAPFRLAFMRIDGTVNSVSVTEKYVVVTHDMSVTVYDIRY